MSDAQRDGPFDLRGGSLSYRGIPVEFQRVCLGEVVFELAGLRDAADLLDDADFAARFLERDMAPYGLQLWPASVALAELLWERESAGRGRAIELGCGVGLVSLVLARQGWSVTATDYDPAALEFTAYNARRNGGGDVQIASLDWRDPPRDGGFDLVVGSDLTYQLADHEPLLACIQLLLTPGGRAYLSDPGRGIADRVPEVASAARLEVRELLGGRPAGPIQAGGKSSPRIRVWQLTRREGG